MATKKGTATIGAEEARWRAQSDADTLSRAQEIMADSKRLKAAQGSAREELARLNRVVKCAQARAGRETPQVKGAR